MLKFGKVLTGGLIMRKPRPSVIGLCLLVALCLLALTAAPAQPETGANWMVNGANINSTLLPSVQIKEVETLPATKIRHLVLLGTIAGANFEVLCTGMTLVEAVLKAAGGSLGKARFTGCVTLIKGAESKACLPKGETKEAGVILTRSLSDLIVLHTPAGGGAAVTLDRIEPEEGSVILSFQTSEECSLGPVIELRGKFFAKDGSEALPTELVTHLFVQGPLTELFINLNPANVANVDGSVVAELSGAHVGLKWSGLPG
jgi:hypothetical protein